MYTHTLAYKSILTAETWQIVSANHDFPLVLIISSVERFTGSAFRLRAKLLLLPYVLWYDSNLLYTHTYVYV